MRSPNRAYISTYGQQDNLGDSVLRRGLLESLRNAGLELHLHIGDNSNDYNSGLHLQAGDRLYTSRRQWWLSMLTRAPFGRANYFFNAGESGAGSRYVSKGTAVLLRVLNLLGGRIFHLGVGLRKPTTVNVANVRAVLKDASVVTWRDPISCDSTSLGSVQPDWAFALRAMGEAAESREILAVTMRGDRADTSAAWVATVADLAATKGLRIVVFNQVRRDAARSEALAEALGGELMLWPDDVNHAQWERTVRTLFSSSAGVVSDRLHALIIGATEGASPLGLTIESAEKLKRTLDPVGWSQYCFSVGDQGPAGDLLQPANRVKTGVDDARARLSDLTADAVGRTGVGA